VLRISLEAATEKCWLWRPFKFEGCVGEEAMDAILRVICEVYIQEVKRRKYKLETLRHTITFGYNLSNSLQTLHDISHFELYFNEDEHHFSPGVEIVETTLGTNGTVDKSLQDIPHAEIELLKEVVENLLVVVDFRERQRKNQNIAPKRKVLISPLVCNAGEGPYCINITSMSITNVLKSSVGIRERRISKDPMSFSSSPGRSPTRGALDHMRFSRSYLPSFLLHLLVGS